MAVFGVNTTRLYPPAGPSSQLTVCRGSTSQLAARRKPEKIGLVFQQIKSVHFVGIGGTAMASVAAAMQQKGFHVTGSDQNVYPPMSTFLAERKIDVRSG